MKHNNIDTESGKEIGLPGLGNGPVLRSSRANSTARKYKAYTQSFNNGLARLKQIFEHLMSPGFKSESAWDLYVFFAVQNNISEGLCDTLLAVTEATRPVRCSMSMPDSELVELGKHVFNQTLKFIEDDIPGLLQCPKGLHLSLWTSLFASTTSQGFKASIESMTARFLEDLDRTFSPSGRSWTYDADFLYGAFRKITISLEESLQQEYERSSAYRTVGLPNGLDTLAASVSALSLSSSQYGGLEDSRPGASPSRPSATRDAYRRDQAGAGVDYRNETLSPSRSPASHIRDTYGHSGLPSNNRGSPRIDELSPSRAFSIQTCYRCRQPGHFSESCTVSRNESASPPGSSTTPVCRTCGQPGHYSNTCAKLRSDSLSPSRPSTNQACYNCSQLGHFSRHCTVPRNPVTPPRSPATGDCFSCGQAGHWSRNCPTPRNQCTPPSPSPSKATCYNCQQVGHYSRDCGSPRKRRECFRCGQVGHYASVCTLR